MDASFNIYVEHCFQVISPMHAYIVLYANTLTLLLLFISAIIRTL